MLSRIFAITLLAIVCVSLSAIEPTDKKSKSKKEEYSLTKEIPGSSVKNQYKTNVCWSFAGISFLESELLRKSNQLYDLSEMYIVRNTYGAKAKKYVRMHGTVNFAAGGEPNDVINVFKEKGIVPESAYSGLLIDSANHIHYEMDEVLRDYIDGVIKNPNKKLSNVWYNGFMSIIDSYLGESSESFMYEGKEFTPESFAATLDINPDDYVLVGSFSHTPFYEPFILEIPDNWSWAQVQNLPLNEFTDVVDNALKEGYSMVWAADVSEKGFIFSEGIAVAPKVLYQPESIEEERKYSRMAASKRNKLFADLDNPVEEIEVCQEVRQAAFDNYTTQDDHSMHLVGFGKDKNNKKYYYIKNSWGTGNKFGGYQYVSEAYFKYKTIMIMLHKEAIPKEIRLKLDI